MNTLPPIPSPIKHRWRQFRIRLMPVFVFLGVMSAVVMLWRDNVAAPTLVGEIEPVQATVSSYKPGLLAQLNVNRFQRVKAGDDVAKIVITDPRILSSSLAVIQAEIELLRVGMRPLLGAQRDAVSYDELKLNWMKQRVQLDTARVNLQLAESELARTDKLFKDKIVSERVFEQAKAGKEKLRTEVDELSKNVANQEQDLKQLRVGETEPANLVSTNLLRASIAVQEEKLRLTEAELSPITLKVPVDGMVSMIYRRSGETIQAGEPIIAISAFNSDRIVGYLRQPLPLEPQVGMPVKIRTRGLHREVSLANIVEVGAQMQPITAELLPPIKTGSVELGLPISVSLPASLKGRPGELVDLTILPGAL